MRAIFYTEESIQAVDELRDEFEARLSLAKQGNQESILAEVKNFILKLNDFNAGFDGDWIESGERDDLGRYIDDGALAAGLIIEKGKDITEEWREW